MTENHGVPGSIPGLATRLLARRGAKFPSPEHLVPDGVPNPPVIALEALGARRTTARRGDPPPVARAGPQRQGDQAQDRGRLYPVWRGGYVVGRPPLTLYG